MMFPKKIIQQDQLNYSTMQLESDRESSSQQEQVEGEHIPTHDISNLPAKALFSLAEQKYQQLDYEQAEQLYSLAYNKDPENQTFTLCYAHLLKQVDKEKKALKVLQNSIANQPKGTQAHKRYFELAQLYDGQQAIRCFERGIKEAEQILGNPFRLSQEALPERAQKPKKKKGKKGKNSKQMGKEIMDAKQIASTVQNSMNTNELIERETRAMIAEAYSSIAQICMTDLLEVPAAQKVCLNALNQAENYDGGCLDAHLQWANYLLFKDQQDGARKRLLFIHQELMKKRQTEQNQYQGQQPLPYQLGLQTSKYLIETENFKQCHDILTCLNEDISSSQQEILYLLSFCSFNLQDYDKCEEEIFEYESGKDDKQYDLQVEEAMNQLKTELAKKKKTNQQQSMGEETGGMDVQGDDDWEDQDDQ